MDPFTAILWMITLVFAICILTPAVKIFNFALRSIVKSVKKTLRVIVS